MQVRTAKETVGWSPKAVLAFFYPLILAVAASAVSWVVTGNFSDSEIRTALSGVVLSAVAALGAYVGAPGRVRVGS